MRRPSPPRDLVAETLEARLLPGEGAIPLVRWLRILDEIGSGAPIGVEVFSKALDALPPVEVGRRCGAAARAVLAAARPVRRSAEMADVVHGLSSASMSKLLWPGTLEALSPGARIREDRVCCPRASRRPEHPAVDQLHHSALFFGSERFVVSRGE